MRNLIKTFIFFIVMFTLSGCIEVNIKVNVNNDGSGTIDEKVFFSKQLVEMLSSFGSMGDSTSDQKFELFNEKELKANALKMGNGVTFISGKKISENGKQGYLALYSFNDITKLKLNEDPGNKVPANTPEQNDESKNDNITFAFSKGEPAELIVRFPKKMKTSENAGESREVKVTNDTTNSNLFNMDQLKAIFKDFKVKYEISVNGKITETNAEYRNGNSVTLFEMDFSKLIENPEELKKFKSEKPKSFQETKDLLKQLPGFKIDTNEEVIIKFK
ncbi:hypothetical protein BMS3Abin04_02168 [bacterium BMS3Abin04]|nr:hypothetical protein BMS3Abin04_02168 [bacterium BMS3Abin04]